MALIYKGCPVGGAMRFSKDIAHVEETQSRLVVEVLQQEEVSRMDCGGRVEGTQSRLVV
ncbi:hypothetical protein GDO81_020776 [Engystomops pustulosus]|uniref:Uncharacterized protein n=1 Tax=Engystomops pustulosus TaxID=76066 RepID=A0AAV6YWG9_ENGPU|nr:hypothetical protein GDO81_020776 [Engystomops pustulosus]KAG8539534.1 hypothetical protein GDO81_020776 [Engystomops pustulosus]